MNTHIYIYIYQYEHTYTHTSCFVGDMAHTQIGVLVLVYVNLCCMRVYVPTFTSQFREPYVDRFRKHTYVCVHTYIAVPIL